MKNFDPVEKIVEQLFFHLVFQANAGKSFVYASLDGNAETTFGDAVAMIDKVFVFEFKRSLNGLSDELGKYQATSQSALFEKVSQTLKSVEKAKQLADLSASAHTLIALAGSNTRGSNILIKSPANASSLEIRPYLRSLTKPAEKGFKDEEKSEILQLIPGRGMDIDLAQKYFDFLSCLRGKKSPSGGSTSVYACFAVNDTGSIGIVQCQGLEGLLQAFDLVQTHNKHVENMASLERAKQNGYLPSMEM